jgi:cell filamentation protein
MSKYTYNARPDPYCYSDSDVLINNFGIKNAAELEAVERELTLNRLGELMQKPVTGRFGFTHLKKIHKAIFGDLYEWAGQPRKHGFISKGQTIFCNASFIDKEAKRIFDKLTTDDNKLRNLDFNHFVEKLVYYSSEINVLHPFREGKSVN